MLLAYALVLALGTPPLTPPELAQVLQGEVVVRSETSVTPSGKTAGYGIGAIAIDRSMAETWKVLANYDDKAEYQPRVEKCAIVSREGDVLHVAMEVNATLMTVRYTGVYTLDPAAHSVSWRLDKDAAGNTIKDMDGSYTLVLATPTRTLLYFRTYVDSGLLVPRFIQNHFSVKAIPELLKSIKQRVESGGTWHK
jgi:hypothetical protein